MRYALQFRFISTGHSWVYAFPCLKSLREFETALKPFIIVIDKANLTQWH